MSTFDEGTAVPVVVVVLGLMGLGFALFSSPNTNAVMSSVAGRDYGVAASMLGTMRSVGQSLSMAIMSLLFTIYVGRVQVSPAVVQQDPAIGVKLLDAMRVGFHLFTVLSVVGLVISLTRGRVRRG